eukprot:scaffold2752_cov393-Prasinococcus_capsulatus_cf.AAC.40
MVVVVVVVVVHLHLHLHLLLPIISSSSSGGRPPRGEGRPPLMKSGIANNALMGGWVGAAGGWVVADASLSEIPGHLPDTHPTPDHPSGDPRLDHANTFPSDNKGRSGASPDQVLSPRVVGMAGDLDPGRGEGTPHEEADLSAARRFQCIRGGRRALPLLRPFPRPLPRSARARGLTHTHTHMQALDKQQGPAAMCSSSSSSGSVLLAIRNHQRPQSNGRGIRPHRAARRCKCGPAEMMAERERGGGGAAQRCRRVSQRTQHLRGTCRLLAKLLAVQRRRGRQRSSFDTRDVRTRGGGRVVGSF